MIVIITTILHCLTHQDVARIKRVRIKQRRRLIARRRRIINKTLPISRLNKEIKYLSAPKMCFLTTNRMLITLRILTLSRKLYRKLLMRRLKSSKIANRIISSLKYRQ